MLRTAPPKRAKNAELQTREHFTPDEVEALMEAARGNRYGHRDATMILLTYRHGLRAAEVCDPRWDQVDFNGAVQQRPPGQERHPEHPPDPGRRTAVAAPAASRGPDIALRVRQRAGIPVHHGRLGAHDRARGSRSRLELKAHPHMLRHACGYALANKGHDTRAIQGWLGHRSITSTAIYTAQAPNQFKDFWGE
jgi:integrase